MEPALVRLRESPPLRQPSRVSETASVSLSSCLQTAAEFADDARVSEQKNTDWRKRELESGCAGGGGTHFRSVDAKAEMREVSLAEGHEARIEVPPDE